MGQLKDEMIPFIKSEEIDQITEGLVREIEADYGDKEIIVICVLCGAFVFFSDLVRKFKQPLSY